VAEQNRAEIVKIRGSGVEHEALDVAVVREENGLVGEQVVFSDFLAGERLLGQVILYLTMFRLCFAMIYYDNLLHIKLLLNTKKTMLKSRYRLARNHHLIPKTMSKLPNKAITTHALLNKGGQK